MPTLTPIYGGMTPSGWPNWPEQPTPPANMQIMPSILSHFHVNITFSFTYSFLKYIFIHVCLLN